jgi:hypothetical protein
MDQSTHQVSNNVPLDRFVARALSELPILEAEQDAARVVALSVMPRRSPMPLVNRGPPHPAGYYVES